MKRLFKKTSFPYLSLQGKTVAVRTIEKVYNKGAWNETDYKRSYDIVHIEEISYNSFVTPENSEYSFADIIRVF